jgi:tRNA dimethylallyltransferase
MDQRNLLVLVGPTAVGKTDLSLDLAEYFSCEIISADSMQIYRGMDIGTAKASKEEMDRIPHHLIDICNPDDPFSVTDYQQEATRHIEEISQRGHLPFMVGGTGLYIQSVAHGYEFSEGGADKEYREKLGILGSEQGGKALLQMLRDIDPPAADRLHPNDQRRIIRALEIYHVTGETMTEHLNSQQLTSPYRLLIIGLNRDRKQLYERVNERVDLMLEEGLVEEVRSLLNAGYSGHLTSMQGLGYKEIASYLHGRFSLEEAAELLKRNTRRFAKRQLSWFRRMKEIEWFDMTDSAEHQKHLKTIRDRIEGKFIDFVEYNSDNAKK